MWVMIAVVVIIFVSEYSFEFYFTRGIEVCLVSNYQSLYRYGSFHESDEKEEMIYVTFSLGYGEFNKLSDNLALTLLLIFVVVV